VDTCILKKKENVSSSPMLRGFITSFYNQIIKNNNKFKINDQFKILEIYQIKFTNLTIDSIEIKCMSRNITLFLSCIYYC
jgi:hypothetical protein